MSGYGRLLNMSDYILTENGDRLLTEDGNNLLITEQTDAQPAANKPAKLLVLVGVGT